MAHVKYAGRWSSEPPSTLTIEGLIKPGDERVDMIRKLGHCLMLIIIKLMMPTGVFIQLNLSCFYF